MLGVGRDQIIIPLGDGGMVVTAGQGDMLSGGNSDGGKILTLCGGGGGGNGGNVGKECPQSLIIHICGPYQ